MLSQFDQAVALQESGQYEQARSLYTSILKQDPAHVASLLNLGAISFATDQLETAVKCYSIALKIDPVLAEAYYNRGCAQHIQGHIAEAEQDYRHCLKLRPGHQLCLENLIAVLHSSQVALPELTEHLRNRLAISRDPDYLLLLGNTCSELGDTEAAISAYREARSLSPLEPAANYFLSTHDLRDRPPELHELSLRWSIPAFSEKNPARIVPLPMWQGESLIEKSLYVSAEQGLGDQVLYSSVLRTLSAKSITWETEPRLAKTLARSFPAINVVPAPNDVTFIHDIDWLSHDTFCPAADLPGLHEHLAETANDSWLIADADLADDWGNWLAQFSGLKVGLSWQGGSSHNEVDKHSIPLMELAPLLGCPDVQFISVQYNPDPAEMTLLNTTVAQELMLPPDLDCREDIEGLLALMSGLDLVITIDNATAYLAAAVGTPVWVLLPLAADWRWSTGADWQTGITQFHNQQRDDWRLTINQVALALLEQRPRPQKAIPLTGIESTGIESTGIECRATAMHSPNVLILNDSINYGHWGNSLACLELHRICQQQGFSTGSFPIQGLLMNAGHAPAIEEFAARSHWNRFLSTNPHLANALQRCEKVIVDGEITPDVILLLYVAYGASRFHDKPLLWVNHGLFTEVPDETLLRQIEPVYQEFDQVVSTNQVSADVITHFGLAGSRGGNLLPLGLRDWPAENTQPSCHKTILFTGGDRANLDHIDELVTLIEATSDEFRYQFLTGSRSALNPDDIMTMRILQNRVPDRVQVVHAHSESEWIRCIGQAACIVSGQPHHTQAAQLMQRSWVGLLQDSDPALAASTCTSSHLSLADFINEAICKGEVITTSDWLELSRVTSTALLSFLDTSHTG